MSETQRRRIDQILEAKFGSNLDKIALDELRARRRVCDEVDTELSYYRRLLHGRMDLLAFELRRRRGEEERSLIEALPEVLAGTGTEQAESTSARAVSVALPELPEVGRRPVDRAFRSDFLTRLPELDEAELSGIQRMLTDAEQEVSTQRRAVYEVYERIQAELTRRYREGLADVDELLHSG